jgi:methylmalonyl-CoA mutase cobalamin-binding subunit
LREPNQFIELVLSEDGDTVVVSVSDAGALELARQVLRLLPPAGADDSARFIH